MPVPVIAAAAAPVLGRLAASGAGSSLAGGLGRGLGMGMLLGGGKQAPEQPSADPIQAISANLNPAQFG